MWLVAIVLILGCLVNLYWSPKLADKLRATVLSSTDSLYSLDFANVSLHFFSGRIVFDQIHLKPNLEVYNRRKKQHLAPNSLYTLYVKRLTIDHVHPLMLYFDKKLDITQIAISKPNLRVDYEQNRDQDTIITGSKTPYQLISKVLKSIHVESIVLDDVKFRYTNHSSSKPDEMQFDQLNFMATEFLLDSVSQKDKTRFLFCKDLRTELNNYEGTSDDRRYHYKMDNLTFSTGTSQLNITGISLLPISTPENFFKTTQSDCFKLKLDSVRLDNFDFRLYSKYHKIYASTLMLGNGSFDIIDNPAPNDTTRDGSNNFPHVLLGQLKMDVRIDTVQIRRTNISYTEFNAQSEQWGTIYFNNTSGLLFNVTNNKAALQKNNIATAKLQSYLMNNGPLDAQFVFNLTDANAAFSFRGRVSAMDLKKINPVAAPLGMVKIASGKLKSLDFDIHADKKVAKGPVTVIYNDLKISVLQKDNENKLKKMGIMSLLANAMVIKRNNPSLNEAPRTFRVNYVRKRSQSIFTYMWKSLFLGIKSSAGYDATTEQTVKKKITDFTTGKAERKAKKALRIQHRNERRQRREELKQKNELRKQQ